MNARRTVAAMYGAGVPVEDAPKVGRVIDGEDFTVAVDLTPAADVLLEALAVAIHDDPALGAEWSTLGRNRSEDRARRDLALFELLTNRAVREALTVRLTPDTATSVADALEVAALEPARCGYGGGSRSPEPGCGAYVEDFADRCPAHSDPDDADTVREYGL